MKKFIGRLVFFTLLLFCTWNLAFSIEKDLKFLTYLSNEDLQPLVAIVENKQENKLSDKIKNNPKEHLDEIMDKLEKGEGPFSYRQIIEQVCKKENIEFDKTTTTEQLGNALIKKVFADSIDKMGIKQKENLIKETRDTMSEEEFDGLLQKSGGTNGFFISSGQTITNLLLDAYSKDEILAIYIVTGIVDCFTPQNSEPIYLVNVPAVTYIEAMRMIQSEKDEQLYDTDSSGIFVIVLIPVMFILFLIVVTTTSKRNNSLFGKIINFLVVAVLFFLITFFSIAIVEEFNVIFIFFLMFFVIFLYLWVSMQFYKKNNLSFFSRLLNYFVTFFLLVFILVSLISSYDENGNTILFIVLAGFFLILLFIWRSIQYKK
ncbi:hypothetical protein [Candidatus Ruminimicrobium bovinum]|uniref:hypothetical protein n=1 Tax=Candidatus Ruminimicrobium bovinum TaxID=3242779 RepID=UPI0039B93DB5